MSLLRDHCLPWKRDTGEQQQARKAESSFNLFQALPRGVGVLPKAISGC